MVAPSSILDCMPPPSSSSSNGLTHHTHSNGYGRSTSGVTRSSSGQHLANKGPAGERPSSPSGGGGASYPVAPFSPLALLHSLPARLCLFTACLVLAAYTWRYADTQHVESFLLRLQRDPYGSLPLFMVLYIASVVLMFPCMIVQVMSGAIYGFTGGLLVSWVATCAGQSLAFLLGRYFFRAAVKQYLNQHFPLFVTIDHAMRKEGWKLVCLLRLSPVLPYNVLNYAAACTPVSFWMYSAASAVATIPWTALYTYVGTLCTSVMDLARGTIKVKGGGSALRVSPTLSALLMIGSIVYGYVLSKRAIDAVLRDAAAEQRDDDRAGGGADHLEQRLRSASSGGGGGGDVEMAPGGANGGAG